MPEKDMNVELTSRDTGKSTIWTATNLEDHPMEFEVSTTNGTRVITIVQPGGFLQVITTIKEDANIICREITGKGAH